MTEGYDQDQAAGSEGTEAIPNLQGSISMMATGGSHTSNQVGQSPAAVDWTQGSAPVASAQFSLAHMPRIPMPPPPQVTDLKPGENSIPFFGDWSSASLSWTYGGDAGAATFAWGMGGLPTGPTGASCVSEVVGPQKGNFQIAFANEPTSCSASRSIRRRRSSGRSSSSSMSTANMSAPWPTELRWSSRARCLLWPSTSGPSPSPICRSATRSNISGDRLSRWCTGAGNRAFRVYEPLSRPLRERRGPPA